MADNSKSKLSPLWPKWRDARILLRSVTSIQTILFLVFCCWISSIITSASATGPTKNYHIYDYDQTNQQFTPDGRLLQVEYASNAAELSSPLVVVECLPSSANEDDPASPYPCLILMTTPKQIHAPQQRIVILDHPASSTRSTAVVAMTGILADSLALLQATLRRDAEHVGRFQKPLSVVSLAQTMADECQKRVFGGGIRPYGSTMLVCGYGNVMAAAGGDDENSSFHHQSLIFQTDPSGAIMHHTLEDGGATVTRRVPWQKASSEDAKPAPTVYSHVRAMVGGTETAQRQLRKQLQQGMGTLEQKQHQQPVTLADRIATMAKILIKETRNTDSSKSGKEAAKQDISDTPLEIVVVSPQLGGSYRLEDDQIDRIRQIIGNNS